MRRVVLVTAVLVAAVIFFLLATLPPGPAHAEWRGDPALAARTIAGAYHVHTTRSDGANDRDAVAAAAARAGLNFVIFTDHGDGTRQPDSPAYVSGVLCIDGVEISTNGGHYVALGMAQSPYPLGGEPAAVAEDVARLGGLGFIAHPDSERAELEWTEWTVPFDGIEWLNADSEWRDESRTRLTRALFDYLVRPAPALASILDRPDTTLARWDAVSAGRPVIALAGHDAHGGIGRGVEDGGRRGIQIPSYESAFRSFSTRVVLDAPPSGDAARDARALLDGIAGGRAFTAIDAVAAPALLDLRGSGAGVSVDASMPPGARLVVIHDGVEASSAADGHAEVGSSPGGFRVEVRVPGAPGSPPVPWILSNAVYPVPPVAPPQVDFPVSRAPFPAVPWHVEHDPSSMGTVSPGVAGSMVDYRLGSGDRNSQFAALVADLSSSLVPPSDGVGFQLRGSRPMRVSVQVRTAGGQRWGRSVHVSREFEAATVMVDQMLPLDGQTGSLADLSFARALLFVVDLTNASPGDRGIFEVASLGLVSRRPSVPGQSPEGRR